MANEFLAQLTPRSFSREAALGEDISKCLVSAGDLYGLSLNKLDTQGYTCLVPISHANTFGTGITLSFYVVDDGANAADLGKVIVLGVTPKRLVDAETTDIDTGAASEATVSITLESTSQNITVNTLAIANAALDSLATGEALILRIRRIGSNASDTAPGRAVLLGVSIKNT